MFFGLILSVSGVVLDFPFLIDSARDPLALALTVHAIAAVIILAFALGHMYLGSIGTEGTMNSMKSGWVDKNWARMHHGIWYETVEKTAERLGKEG
jgi:formate dehydrogenase subunit gamma